MGRVVEVQSLRDIADCRDDLVSWAAQDLGPGIRAWRLADAFAVASPQLSRRDRLAVCGPGETAATLVRHALGELGPSFRPIGSADLIAGLCDRIPSLHMRAAFGWMHGARPPPPDARARELPSRDLVGVDELLDVASPDSYARPGMRGVRRWWGVVDESRVLACAADAWSAPTVGFLAGVATHPAARGRGFGRAAVSVAIAAMIESYGQVGLMVDSTNAHAQALYASLGFVWRDVAAAELRG